MSHGSGVDSTTETGVVVEENSNTAPAPSVSTQTASTAPGAIASRASDPDVRIRNLQSELDKAKTQANTLVLEKSTLQNEIAAARSEKNSAIEQAASATRAAMTRSEESERENATLKARLARAEFLVANADLAAYSSLVPETTDKAQLDAVAREIRAARQRDLEALRAQVAPSAIASTTTTAPAASAPAGTSAGESPPAPVQRRVEEMNRALREVRGDPKRFEELLREFASSLQGPSR